MKKNTKLFILCGVVCVLLLLSLYVSATTSRVDQKFKNINWSGHSVDPNITPLPSKNGWPRYSEFDPMSQRPIKNGGRKDVKVKISETAYSKVFDEKEKIILVKYKASGNAFNDQFTHLIVSSSTGYGIQSVIDTYFGDTIKVVYAKDDDNPSSFSDLTFDPSKPNQAIALKYHNALLLNLSSENAHAVASINSSEGRWTLHHILPVELISKDIEVPILDFDKFLKEVESGNYFMYWRSYNDVPAHIYSDLGPGSNLVLNSINPAYIAQSKALIPAYLICGYQELVKSDGQKIHYDACGVTEAVDYGDYY